MLSLTYYTLVLLCATGCAAGFAAGWINFGWRTRRDFVATSRHDEALRNLRRRYRQRLRAAREAVLEQRGGAERLRAELRAATAREASHAEQLAAARDEAAIAQARANALQQALRDRDHGLDALREQRRVLERQLAVAQERIAALEGEQGLLRIERDELVARTHRLRALPATPSPAGNPRETGPEAPATALRAELADRDARIHELEWQLRESTSRLSEVESNLHTWKYRIAPVALHLHMQRERRRAAAGNPARGGAGPDAGDDLQRIRSIGRALEKKLRAEGVSRFAQIAAMSPAELADLAVRVGLAASRPERERWREQAREQADLDTATAPAPRAEAG